VGELELVRRIRELVAPEAAAWLEVGIGDDAAVLRLPGHDRVIVTTDMVSEGVHFEPGTAPEAIGWKAVARSLSDLAAMAARPLCVLAAMSFGAGADLEFAWRLSQAVCEAAGKLSAPLVGGDVASGAGPLSLTVTALGLAGPAGVVRRAGASPGDAVCVTGAFGGSLRGRHLSFRPRVEEALDLAERFKLHAMIDVSDGLSTDMLHLAEESGVGMVVDAAAIPVHPDALVASGSAAAPDAPLRHALGDGEDYELIFCTSASEAEEAAHTGTLGTPVSIIGRATRERNVTLVWPDGRREQLRGTGWEHLRA